MYYNIHFLAFVIFFLRLKSLVNVATKIEYWIPNLICSALERKYYQSITNVLKLDENTTKKIYRYEL